MVGLSFRDDLNLLDLSRPATENEVRFDEGGGNTNG
jgi:hypothetical protein